MDISVQVENGLTDDCHFVIVPVFPDNVSNPLVLPEHNIVPPVILPPTDVALTFISTTVEVFEQPPELTVLLNQVS